MSKKIIALVLAVLVAAISFVFVACNGNEDSDLEYVKSKGKLVVGITEFEPMDYKDKDSGEWIGFDADLAKAFAKELGVDVEFVEIVWDNKIIDLNGKNIDCVWNGMTITDEVKNGMEVSNAYCKNTQVVVVKKDVADKYKTIESVKDLKFAAEAGSAGEKALKDLGYSVTAVIIPFLQYKAGRENSPLPVKLNFYFCSITAS